jgi:death on curing protein
MPEWVAVSVALAIHDAQLAEHGGAAGMRDLALLESALARPQNLLAHSQTAPELADLAAAYAWGIARNHPFGDANKRTSRAVTLTFLELNGHELRADEAEHVAVWIRLADGSISESEFADWLRHRLAPLSPVQPR